MSGEAAVRGGVGRVVPAVLVHGGVGRVPESEIPQRLASCEQAARAAHSVLAAGGSALDAAVAAVVVMEDAPLLNAGHDCCLNLDGQAEFDASVMDSGGLCGGVGAVQEVRNPVQLARAVAERTEHRLLVGPGALRFAKLLGLPTADAVTQRTRQRYAELVGRMKQGATAEEAPGARLPPWQRLPELLDLYGLHSTVGAVALDGKGGLAAATSTGGIWLKLPGRVGDSAVIGAGTYCDASGAASATGMGDGILKLGSCRAAVERLASGANVHQSARDVVELASEAKVDLGILLLAADGNFAAVHNCQHMPRAAIHGLEPQVLVTA